MNCADTGSLDGCPRPRLPLFAFLVLCFCCFGSDARADWLFAGYLGASHTPGNTLTVMPASGSPQQTVHVASYDARPFIAPQYYGVRIGWLPPATRGLGFEGEWTHAKAYGEGLSSGSDLTYFAQSHGLNFLLGNAVYRFTPGCGGCAFSVRGGLGISTPHVETTIRNVRVEHYQYGGVAWQLGAGVEYRVWQFVYGVGDARITRVSEQHLRGNAAEVAGSFFTSHVDFGIALRVPSP
jgi:lipid A oxidase